MTPLTDQITSVLPIALSLAGAFFGASVVWYIVQHLLGISSQVSCKEITSERKAEELGKRMGLHG